MIFCMKQSPIVIGSVVVGVLFVAIAIYYWVTPAGHLPTYFPGYEAGSMTVHFKHGLGSLILGIALFIYAWFQDGANTKKLNEQNAAKPVTPPQP